ncbi:MAG TPA: PilZ domain-containing protein [Pirellulales bacterium]|nr:PilZ domain-containing protein [Pirellulales bacterium]
MNAVDQTEAFYELNPDLLEKIVENLERDGGRPERRRSPRQKFPVQQWMAPFVRKMPKAEQFVPVECRDLSSSGLAFYWPQRANFAKVIIGLGRAPQLTYVAARIVRQVACTNGGGVLVGCEFVDRVGIS